GGGLAGGVDGRVTSDGELGNDQGVAFDIAVVGEHVAGGRRVFDDRDRPVVARHRCVVDRADIVERELGGIGQAAVCDGVGGGRHRAGVVDDRGEGVAAIAIDEQGADTGDGGGL